MAAPRCSLCSSLALLLGSLSALAVSADAYKTGDGTAYSGAYEKDKTGFNSCGFGELDPTWETMYAALPSHVFDRESDCGRCIRVRGTENDAPGDWVTAMVVDECAGCKGDGDVDFSSPALKAITGYSWDRKKIEWEFVDCPSGDSTSEDDSSDASSGDDSSDSSGDDSSNDSSDSADSADSSGDDDSNDSSEDSSKRRKDRRLMRF